MSDADSLKPVIILVHGTFAANDADACPNGKRWWQHDSAFCIALDNKLGGSALVAPDSHALCDRPRVDAVFHWSGLNSECARKAAGRSLLKLLLTFEAAKRHYHIIGHSHGGSVVWQALCNSPSRSAGIARLRYLKGWTTVGTPFLFFIPDITLLPAAIVGVVAFSVASRQSPWLIDSWNSVFQHIALPWWRKCLESCLLYMSAALLVAMIAHAIYRLYALRVAQNDPRTYSDIPGNEWKRSKRAVLPLFGLAAIVALWRYHDPEFHQKIVAAFTDPLVAANLAYTVLLLICAGVALVPLAFALIIQPLSCLREKSRAERAWSDFSGRYSCILSPRVDEAFNGLRTATHGIRGPLLPRMRVPGSAFYSGSLGRISKPELRESPYWYLLLSIPVDWLFRPFYNNVFAPLTDAFVLRRLTRQAHGADILGLCLGGVAPTPIPITSTARTSRRIKEMLATGFQPTVKRNAAPPETRWCGPLAHTCDELDKTTRASASELWGGIRQRLGEDSPTAVSLPGFLRRAMQGDADVSSVLVHTSYFENAEVISLIASRISQVDKGSDNCNASRDTGGPLPGNTPEIRTLFAQMLQPEPLAEHEHFDWPPRDFAWWIVRVLVFSAVLSVPGLVLAAVGWWYIYPQSREAGLAWARDISMPFLDAASDKGQLAVR